MFVLATGLSGVDAYSILAGMSGGECAGVGMSGGECAGVSEVYPSNMKYSSVLAPVLSVCTQSQLFFSSNTTSLLTCIRPEFGSYDLYALVPGSRPK